MNSEILFLPGEVVEVAQVDELPFRLRGYVDIEKTIASLEQVSGCFM